MGYMMDHDIIFLLGLFVEESEDIRFKQILNATEVTEKTFLKKEFRWTLPENTGLVIHNPSGLDLDITIKFKLVLPDD